MQNTNKINILFVISQMSVGGSERIVLDLAQNLNFDQYKIYIATFKDGVLSHSFRHICQNIFLIDKKRRFDIHAMFQLATIIRKHGIDIVNAHHYMPCFYSFLGTRILNRKKLIYTEHSVPEVEGIASGMHGKILNTMLFRINAVVGVSREITEKFKEHYPRHAQKIHEIPNGIDIDKFSVKVDRNHIRQRWGLTNDHFVIGTVANFRRVKNHVCLLRAAARLKGGYPQLRLFFVGTGFPGDPENSEQEIRQLIHELGLQDRVILAGYQDNIFEILSDLDAFCLPSFSEGLPVSVLEAMAAGVPVIGSHVRGIKEVVQDRETGLLFSSDNDSELARALEEILTSPNFSQTLTNKAYYFVEKKHNMKIWIQKTSALFLSNG